MDIWVRQTGSPMLPVDIMAAIDHAQEAGVIPTQFDPLQDDKNLATLSAPFPEWAESLLVEYIPHVRLERWRFMDSRRFRGVEGKCGLNVYVFPEAPLKHICAFLGIDEDHVFPLNGLCEKERRQIKRRAVKETGVSASPTN